MRKLTVKNFSVIKDAELEFGKITVLIGPQSSGKSLLCKLAYFLSREVLKIAAARVIRDFDFSAFEIAMKKTFSEWFPASGWGTTDWLISFVSDDYRVEVSGPGEGTADPLHITLKFDNEFGHLYEGLYEEFKGGGNQKPRIEHISYPIFCRHMGRGVYDSAIYFPSERSYFVETQKAYRLLANQPNPIANLFAEFYAESLDLDIPKPRLRLHLKGMLRRGEDSLLFAFDDGRVLPLSNLSSGSKEMLPLWSGLEKYEHDRPATVWAIQEGHSTPDVYRYDEFFIEEPEANIFPEAQYELVRYFAELANRNDLNPTFTITTHSPYILTAFNNLIEAGQVAKAKPELNDEVAKLIPEQYWIKEGDFKAYAIEDGVLTSIVAKDTGLVSANYLDKVSETIGMEFDELLRLGYVES